jgi:hypothetical protein
MNELIMETLEAKLRNQLSPIYGLADMILLLEKKPEIKELLIEQAKKTIANRKVIDTLLVSIEEKNAVLDRAMELIEQGWEFFLHYGDHSTYSDIQEPCWEADFTRKLKNGKWDNHEDGYGLTPDIAIEKAYNNIKNGVRLKKKVNKS